MYKHPSQYPDLKTECWGSVAEGTRFKQKRKSDFTHLLSSKISCQNFYVDLERVVVRNIVYF